jgi:hypothetical protein
VRHAYIEKNVEVKWMLKAVVISDSMGSIKTRLKYFLGGKNGNFEIERKTPFVVSLYPGYYPCRTNPHKRLAPDAEGAWCYTIVKRR